MASTDNSISELSPVESESAFHLAMADHSVPDATPLLDESAFYNKQSKRLFEAIDELRRCGASHDIDLPEVRQPASIEVAMNLKAVADQHSS